VPVKGEGGFQPKSVPGPEADRNDAVVFPGGQDLFPDQLGFSGGEKQFKTEGFPRVSGSGDVEGNPFNGTPAEMVPSRVGKIGMGGI
jgi:hypothetical protein